MENQQKANREDQVYQSVDCLKTIVSEREPKQFWYNQDQGKHYIIDGKGQKKKCDSGGKTPNDFKPYLTGFANFNKRSETIANSEEAVQQTKSLKFLRDTPQNTYIPNLNKFDGYAQFRCPMQINYDSQRGKQSMQIINVEKNPDQGKTFLISRKNIQDLQQSYKNTKTNRVSYLQSPRIRQIQEQNLKSQLDHYQQYLRGNIDKRPHSRASVISSSDFSTLKKSFNSISGNTSKHQSISVMKQIGDSSPQNNQSKISYSNIAAPRKSKDINKSGSFSDSRNVSITQTTHTKNSSCQKPYESMNTLSYLKQAPFIDKLLYKKNSRYMNYSELKQEQIQQNTLYNYNHLQKRDLETLQPFLNQSPRVTIEKAMLIEDNNILYQDEQSQDSPFVKDELKKSVNPLPSRLKTLEDFKKPAMYNENKVQQNKYTLNKGLRRQLKGQFQGETIEIVKNGGQFQSLERKSMRQLNPIYNQEEEKRKKFEFNRIKNKKHQKQLQADALMHEVKIIERKIYKKFIKY